MILNLYIPRQSLQKKAVRRWNKRNNLRVCIAFFLFVFMGAILAPMNVLEEDIMIYFFVLEKKLSSCNNKGSDYIFSRM